MTNMIEGLKRLYIGENTLSRQLVLFSICGTVGLFNAFISFGAKGLGEVTFLHKGLYFLMWLAFLFFLIGFETLFLHERKIPDIDCRSLKLPFARVLFVIFLFSIPFSLVSLFYPQYAPEAFILEIFMAVPFTMLEAGYSYRLENSDISKLFKSFGVKEYFTLILKRLWVIFLAYTFVFSMIFLIFLIFFVVGLVITILFREDLNSTTLLLPSVQLQIIKLSNFIAGILIIYALTIATLVWDYELIKTYEKKEEA